MGCGSTIADPITEDVFERSKTISEKQYQKIVDNNKNIRLKKLFKNIFDSDFIVLTNDITKEVEKSNPLIMKEKENEILSDLYKNIQISNIGLSTVIKNIVALYSYFVKYQNKIISYKIINKDKFEQINIFFEKHFHFWSILDKAEYININDEKDICFKLIYIVFGLFRILIDLNFKHVSSNNAHYQMHIADIVNNSIDLNAKLLSVNKNPCNFEPKYPIQYSRFKRIYNVSSLTSLHSEIYERFEASSSINIINMQNEINQNKVKFFHSIYKNVEIDNYLSTYVKDLIIRINENADKCKIVYLKSGKLIFGRYLIDHVVFSIQKHGNYQMAFSHTCIKSNFLTCNNLLLYSDITKCLIEGVEEISSYFQLLGLNYSSFVSTVKDSPRKGGIQQIKDLFNLVKNLKIRRTILIVIKNSHLLYSKMNSENLFYLLRSIENIIPPSFCFILGCPDSFEYNILNNGNHIQFSVSIKSNLVEKCFQELTHNLNEDNFFEKIRKFLKDNPHDQKELFKYLSIYEMDTIFSKSFYSAIDHFDIFTQLFSNVMLDLFQKESSDEAYLAIRILSILVDLKIPIHLKHLDDLLDIPSETILKSLKSLQNLVIISYSDVEISNENIIVIARSKKKLSKLINEQYKEKLKLENTHQLVAKRFFEEADEGEYENLSEYYTLCIVEHYSESLENNNTESLIRLFNIKWLFAKYNFYKSLDLLSEDFRIILNNPKVLKPIRHEISILLNYFYCCDQSLRYVPLNCQNFFSQIESRVIGEASPLLSNVLLTLSEFANTYFISMFPSLRENNNLEYLIHLNSDILSMKFSSLINSLIISTSSSLVFIFSLEKEVILNSIEISTPILNFICNQNIIFGTTGTNIIFFWNLKNHTEIQSIELNENPILINSFEDNLIFSTRSKKICIYSLTQKKITAETKKNHPTPTALQFSTKEIDKQSQKSCLDKIIVGFSNGTLKFFNHLLEQKDSIKCSSEGILSLQFSLIRNYILVISKDGDIKVIDSTSFTCICDISIFNVANDRLVNALLVDNLGYIVSIESKNIRFHRLLKGEEFEVWNYFFGQEIICGETSQEEEFLGIGDTEGNVSIYNLEKPVEQRKTAYIPSHKRDSSIGFIILNCRTNDENIAISCSYERNFKIWKRNTFEFLKNYNLTSITSEIVTCVSNGCNLSSLFVGTKDTNIYMIDLTKGTITIVFEGHFIRITYLRPLSSKFLLSAADKNVKIWDLESMKCTKSYNSHDYNIICARLADAEGSKVNTIDTQLMFKKWELDSSNQIEEEQNLFKKFMKYEANICEIFGNFIYAGIPTGIVYIFSLNNFKTVCSIPTYRREIVIGLHPFLINKTDYLTVVTKTSCNIYNITQLCREGKSSLYSICSYVLNSIIRSNYNSKESMLHYDNCFTSSAIILLEENDSDISMNHQKTLHKNNIDVPSESSVAMQNEINKEKISEGIAIHQNLSFTYSTEYFHTIRNNSARKFASKIEEQSVVLVCIADSRGYMHVNRLYHL